MFLAGNILYGPIQVIISPPSGARYKPLISCSPSPMVLLGGNGASLRVPVKRDVHQWLSNASLACALVLGDDAFEFVVQ